MAAPAPIFSYFGVFFLRLNPFFPSLGCQLWAWSHFLNSAVLEAERLIESWPFSEWVKNRINADPLKPTSWEKQNTNGEKKNPLGSNEIMRGL